ncbi:hypothetical protein [Paenibacillus sp. FSL R7-0272]|uniref:hypothetical protein n=1 Tax=Paenibacillus sp. FSL R7-0272 TaxID=2921679 RepID=UPI0030EE1CFE
MQVGVYVYRAEEEWDMVMSLDIQVDVLWWLEGMSGRHVQQWLVLSMHLPLSQASWLVDQFVPERSMDMWRMEAWQSYLNTKLDLYEHLSGEIEARRALVEQAEAVRWRNGSRLDRGENDKREKGIGGDGGKGTAAIRAVRVGGMPKPYPAEYWAQLEQCAALLAERMSGRQLLAAEAEALLAAEPAMPPGAGARLRSSRACMGGCSSQPPSKGLPRAAGSRGSAAREARPAATAVAAKPGSACPALPAAWRRAPTARHASR